MPTRLQSLLLLAALYVPALAVSQESAADLSTSDPIPSPVPEPAPIQPAAAPDPVLRATATTVFLTGDYGLPVDTDVFAGIVSLEHDAPRWRARAEISMLSVDGPAVVGTGGASPGARPTTDRTTGLGDTNLEASWKLRPPADPLAIDLTGRVKLPTANEDHGLGTGQIDYFLQVDLRRTVGDWTLFGNVGWAFLGDSARFQLDDGPYATLGAARPILDRTTAGAGLNWRSDTGGGTDDATEAFAFVSRELTPDWRATVIGIVGFTDASPDLGGGVSATYAF